VPVIRSMETVGEEQVPILIEVDAPSARPDSVYRPTRGQRGDKMIESAEGLFRDGMSLARSCAAEVAATFARAGEKAGPNEVEVTVAIKLDAEVGAILAKSSAGAQLDVKMIWKLGE
jgi:hypothetical protein